MRKYGSGGLEREIEPFPIKRELLLQFLATDLWESHSGEHPPFLRGQNGISSVSSVITWGGGAQTRRTKPSPLAESRQVVMPAVILADDAVGESCYVM